MLALLLNVASSHSNVSIGKICESEELTRAVSIELRSSFLTQRSSANPTAAVFVAASAHLEKISCDLDGYPVLATIKLATSLHLTNSIVDRGAADLNDATAGRFVADEVDIAASGSWGRGLSCLDSSGVGSC